MGAIPFPFALSVANSVQGVIIILGNFLAIVVFWRRRLTLKRTSYLLINLATADFIVGVAELSFATKKRLLNGNPGDITTSRIANTLTTLSISASIYSLAIIALERVVAILKPLRHRTAKTSSYVCSIVFIWLLSAFNVATVLVQDLYFGPGHGVVRPILASLFTACLVVICCSYVTIWCHASKRVRDARSQKLAVTLAIVTVFSLFTLVPSQVIMMTVKNNFSNPYFFFAWILLFGNSMVNPFLYVLRMPEFRRETKILFQQVQTCIRGGHA